MLSEDLTSADPGRLFGKLRSLWMDLWSSFIDIRLHRVGRVGIIMGNEVGIRMGNGVGIIMVGRI